MMRLSESQIEELSKEVMLAISNQVGSAEAWRLLPSVVAAVAKAGAGAGVTCEAPDASSDGRGGCSCGQGHCGGKHASERISESRPAGKATLSEPSLCGSHAGGGKCKCGGGDRCLKNDGACVCRSMRESGAQAKDEALAEKLCAVGRRLSSLGMVAGASGNVSVRDSENTFLISPSGVHKGALTPEGLIRVGLDGKVVSGNGRPSSETSIHLAAYRARADVNAVLHAHPPYATSFAAARTTLDLSVLAEAWITLGPKIPLVPFAVPSTPEVGTGLEPYIRGHQAFLLANHGAMTVGKDLVEACNRMETVEFLARVIVNARVLGGEYPLGQRDRTEIAKVHHLDYV